MFSVVRCYCLCFFVVLFGIYVVGLMAMLFVLLELCLLDCCCVCVFGFGLLVLFGCVVVGLAVGLY